MNDDHKQLLKNLSFTIHNFAVRGMRTNQVSQRVAYTLHCEHTCPDVIIVHVGTNDFKDTPQLALHNSIINMMVQIQQLLTKCKGSPSEQVVMFSAILPRCKYTYMQSLQKGISKTKAINRMVSNFTNKLAMGFIQHMNITPFSHLNYRKNNEVHLSQKGINVFNHNLIHQVAHFLTTSKNLRGSQQ